MVPLPCGRGDYLYNADLGVVRSNKSQSILYGTKTPSGVHLFKFVNKHGRTVSVRREVLQAAVANYVLARESKKEETKAPTPGEGVLSKDLVVFSAKEGVSQYIKAGTTVDQMLTLFKKRGITLDLSEARLVDVGTNVVQRFKVVSLYTLERVQIPVLGELAESGNAPVLKIEIPSEPGCVGSNPTLAAKI